MASDTWLQKVASKMGALNVLDRPDSGQTAVYVSGSGIALVRGQITEDDRYQAAMRVDPIAQLSELRATLALQQKSLNLSGRERERCNLVLGPELYTMSMLERPDVADEDLRDAARWALQEQLDHPVENAAIDVFELPRGAARERRMLFAASLPTEFLKSLISELDAAGFTLASIDITDLAVRNLSWRCFPQPDLSLALLRLTASSGLLNVSRGDELYLSRRISGVPAAFAEEAWHEFRDRLLLQVQRSIDYYESSMGQPPCNILLVSCTDDWSDRVTEYLSEMVAMPVRNISDVLAAAVELTLFNPEREVVDWAGVTSRQVNAIAAGLPGLGGALRKVIERAQDEAA